MKILQEEVKAKAEDALRLCLKKVPFLSLESVKSEQSIGKYLADLVTKLTVAGKERTFLVEVKTNGQPKIARDAVNQLLLYREELPKAYCVFIAPYISCASADICESEGVGYLDLSGNCRLSFDNVYIEQRGKPNKFATKRDLGTLYSPKAERVLRVLLANPSRTWKIKELEDEADVSLGQVANVKKVLANREWIQKDKLGFRLTQPEKLLREWAEQDNYRKNTITDFYSLKSFVDIEADIAELLDKEDIRYAFTGFSAAARLSPAVRYNRATVYVEDIKDDLIADLGLKPVPSGANVSLLVPYDAGLFYGASKVDGIRIASAVQVYLDLVNVKGRGQEAASTILENTIRPQW